MTKLRAVWILAALALVVGCRRKARVRARPVPSVEAQDATPPRRVPLWTAPLDAGFVLCGSASPRFICSVGDAIAEFSRFDAPPRTWTVPGKPLGSVAIDDTEIVSIDITDGLATLRALNKASGESRVLASDLIAEGVSAPVLMGDRVYWAFDAARASGGRLRMLMSTRRTGAAKPEVAAVTYTDVNTNMVLCDGADLFFSSEGGYGVYRVRPPSRTPVPIFEVLERVGDIRLMTTTATDVLWTQDNDVGVAIMAAPKASGGKPRTLASLTGTRVLAVSRDATYVCTRDGVVRLSAAAIDYVIREPIDDCGFVEGGVLWQHGDAVYGSAL